MMRVPCGQSSTSFGSIHGCIAVGIRRKPSRPSLSFASFTLSAKARPSPVSDGRGPLHLSSMTCSASSLFQAISPFKNSSVNSPAAACKSASAAGATSRLSPSTSMYSTSSPKASNSPSARLDCGSGGGFELLAGIDARADPFHDSIVERVAEDRVLDAAVDVRVVVDLHEHLAAADGLDVDAVETVADRVRGL